jgi:hypothetical protein
MLSEWSPKLGKEESEEMLPVLLLFKKVPKGGTRAKHHPKGAPYLETAAV